VSDFKVGDKIGRSIWEPNSWFLVEWVGDSYYAGTTNNGEKRLVLKTKRDLDLWLPPFPFKAGDKITMKSGNVECLVVEDPLPGKPQFTARYCDSDRLYPFLKDIPGDSWVAWVPPFPFKAGDVLRRSDDTGYNQQWKVSDPQPGSYYFLGWMGINPSGRPCQFDKECWNGEWVLVPATKKYTVVTENRLPRKGDRYIAAGTFIVATEDHQQITRDVIVSINSESE